jgi:hypothetical protein
VQYRDRSPYPKKQTGVALTFEEVRRLCQVPGSGKVRLNYYDPGWAAHDDFKRS